LIVCSSKTFKLKSHSGIHDSQT